MLLTGRSLNAELQNRSHVLYSRLYTRSLPVHGQRKIRLSSRAVETDSKVYSSDSIITNRDIMGTEQLTLESRMVVLTGLTAFIFVLTIDGEIIVQYIDFD